MTGPVDCIHGPIDINGAGTEVEELRKNNQLEGLQLILILKNVYRAVT
jgi:hypothetical protein